MSLARQVAINFMQEHVHLDLSDDAEAKLQEALTSWFDAAYTAERKRCEALLGAEVMRLLGCRDREDAEGIARAAQIIRESAVPTGGEASDG